MIKVKILLYCTKNGRPLIYTDEYRGGAYWEGYTQTYNRSKEEVSKIWGEEAILNGRIVAECEVEKIDYYEMEYHHDDTVQQSIYIYDEIESEEWNEDCFEMVISNEYNKEEIDNFELLKKSCLTFDELGKYVCPKGGVNNFYALHLKNVKIFDEPKELSDYCVIDTTVEASSKYRKDKYSIYGELVEKKVFRAPQNMQVVFENGTLTNHPCNFSRYKYVLISIKPQHLCKILNGEKTIEVRKSILNSLKEEFNCGK